MPCLRPATLPAALHFDAAGSDLHVPGAAIGLDRPPSYPTASPGTVLAAPSLRPMPVAVLSKTEPFQGLPAKLPAEFTAQDIESRWPLVQAAVVGLQPQTPQIMATGSDHYIQVSQPDLVIDATRLVISRAAANR